MKSEFITWLKKQKDRDDMVGDLAADLIRDKDCNAKTIEAFRRHLQLRRVSGPVIDALNRAAREFDPEYIIPKDESEEDSED